jgi:methionine sulfoxide reductase heme-binding subunit
MGMKMKSARSTPGWICVPITEIGAVARRPAAASGARAWLSRHWLRVVVHFGAWIPLALILYGLLTNQLTVNPIQAATLRTGKTALVLLVLSLACTPLNTVFRFRPALKVRRALGLYAFLYVAIHFAIFVGLDYGFDPRRLLEAVFEKRYALVGFAAGLVLLPLAITSTRGWMRRMGRRWTRLHRLVYLAAALAVVHYTWLVKSDIRVPLLYGALVLGLLALRLPPIRHTMAGLGGRLRRMPAG